MTSMVNVLLFLLFAMFWNAPAQAQTFPKPPDVPAYVSVVPTYAAGTTLNVKGDGSATGGTPPAYAYELPETNSITDTGWSIATTNNCLTTLNGGICTEAKFRFTMSSQFSIKYDDPIRNYGQPGGSHLHCFFNNMNVNAYSTRASLRSTNPKYLVGAGGPLNATGYWVPCFTKTNPFGDGKNYAVKPSGPLIGYYALDPVGSAKAKRPARGLRYVLLTNMDDPDQTWLQARIDIANAQPGTTGRYSLLRPGAGTAGAAYHYTCATSSGQLTSQWLKGTDGSDPFGGLCTAGKDLWVQIVGPTCWDGINLWSPGGYRHVIPGIWDSVANSFVCPNGWYQIPDLQFQIHYTHQGFSDYGNWRLSSDDMMEAKLTALGTPRSVPNGGSFHTDWMEAWDSATFNSWHTYCIGVEGNVPHECNASGFSATRAMITGNGAPSGRSPQIQEGDGVTTSPSGMFLLPSSSNGPKDIHVHGG